MNKIILIGSFLLLGFTKPSSKGNSLSFLTSIYTASEHEFHISRTSLNYDSQSKTYQFTIHIFIDDLTKCLERKGYKNLNIGGKEAPNTDTAIESYIREHVVLVGDKALPYTFLGREFSDDQIALYIYLESDEQAPRKNLAIKNNLLLEEFSDQKNIVDITRNKKRVATVLCEKEDFYKNFTFEN
jgi:hypothetical protein